MELFDGRKLDVHICPPVEECKPDEHVWDGPPHYEQNMGTVTCSKCGAWAINVDMMRF